MEKNISGPILIPFEPEEFWAQIRLMYYEEECSKNKKEQPVFASLMETSGLTEKPLFGKCRKFLFSFLKSPNRPFMTG